MQLYPTTDNPAPLGAKCQPVITKDGVTLRSLYARVANARGTIILIGGRTDFLERHFETLRNFMDQGFSVAALDCRGQGGSDRLKANRQRGHIESFTQYDEDLRAFVTQVMLPDCPPPYFALGHSTGGNLVLRAAAQTNWFDKVVVTAPLLGLNYRYVPKFLAKPVVYFFSFLSAGNLPVPMRQSPKGREQFENNPFTHDYTRWQRDMTLQKTLKIDQILAPSFGWLAAAQSSLRWLNQRIKRQQSFKTGVLAILAGQDKIVDNEATYRFSRRGGHMAIVKIAEARHEILLETDVVRAQFFAAFFAFIENKTAL